MTEPSQAHTEPRVEPGTVTVRVPGPLRQLADGRAEVAVAGGTVGAALDALLERYPGLRRHLRAEDGRLRDHVNVFLNEEDVRFRGGVDALVAGGDTLTIVPSIAGG